MSVKRTFLVRLPELVSNRSPVFIYAFQAFLVTCGLVSGWLLRFDFSIPYGRVLLTSGFLLIVLRLIFLRFFKLDHGWWHFASVSDVLTILKAVGVGSAVFFVVNRYILGATGFPRSIYFLEAVLTASFLAGMRLASRVLAESVRRNAPRSKRVVLVGAGFAAQMVLRELARPESGYVVVGCVDDDTSKLRLRIHGIPVLGAVHDLESLVSAILAEEILIAIPSATGKQMKRITEECQKTKLPFKTVPTLRDIIRGEASVNQFREVRLEDLLGREPVQMDLEAVSRHVKGSVIAVTGASGSIGSELCRQILAHQPARLVCIDQNETGMFYLQLELRQRCGEIELVCCVANIGDPDRMKRCLSDHKVEYVFHAAAYKHVPLMEENVAEAIRNNVFGLYSLIDIAEEAGCRGFILISSDKAVNPTSVMGTSKRIGELMLASRPKKGMRCVAVRFGNVLGSSGSVVPVFQEQLRRGGPLLITHPEIRRFFMTTQEAVSLVLQAFTIGHHGDILVLEMGTPMNILDMARTLIRLSGKSEESIPIQFTGLREGEKLKEELFYAHEEISPTSCDKIKRTSGPLKDWPGLCRQLAELRATMYVDGALPIRVKIREIVPEYTWQLSIPVGSTMAQSARGVVAPTSEYPRPQEETSKEALPTGLHRTVGLG
jgi:FlaA1/EpsC-like NDP-sugar epimerase